MGKLGTRLVLGLTAGLIGGGVVQWLTSNYTPAGFYRATVTQLGSSPGERQTNLVIMLDSGPNAGQPVAAVPTELASQPGVSLPAYHVGDAVLASPTPGLAAYTVIDQYRMGALGYWLGALIGLAVIFAGLRGVSSLTGLAVSAAIIGLVIIPLSLGGANPYLVALLGTFTIATVTIYLAHGFSRRTTLALLSTYIVLIASIGLSLAAVSMMRLTGIATEDVSVLHDGNLGLNLQGLLMTGIIIGVLGALDDITVGQAAAIDEIRKANSLLKWRELYRRGLSVGKEHIASLINTLILTYAGASFLFIVYLSTIHNQPLFVTLNSEYAMEEIVRSLVGSLALILAVPIATFAAAYFLTATPREAIRAVRRRLGRYGA